MDLSILCLFFNSGDFLLALLLMDVFPAFRSAMFSETDRLTCSTGEPVESYECRMDEAVEGVCRDMLDVIVSDVSDSSMVSDVSDTVADLTDDVRCVDNSLSD